MSNISQSQAKKPASVLPFAWPLMAHKLHLACLGGVYWVPGHDQQKNLNEAKTANILNCHFRIFQLDLTLKAT
jgi:hypothetical protein